MLKIEALHTEYLQQRGRPVKAVHDLGFEVPQGRFFTLLGPSGCGKTTTLRSIAGLERPSRGEISLADKTLYSSSRGIFVPPHRRGIGMVFQSYAIWPHMTVFGNVAFPLQVGGGSLARAEIARRVTRVLQAVQLDHLHEREATRLSGGQQQRLALARALVMEPRLLLLDEPLSNLDAKLRDAMRFELKRLQRELRITTVYVTHDQSEALALSHLIGVMKDGRIEQIGTPRDIYERPASPFVAAFVGMANFLDGTVTASAIHDGSYLVQTEVGALRSVSIETLHVGDPVVLSVRPEDLELSEHEPDGANVLHGTVDQKVFLGDNLEFRVRFGDRVLQSRVHPSLTTRIRQPIWARIRPDKCVVIRQTRQATEVVA